MVFIHPVILKDDAQIDALTQQRYNFMRDKQIAYGEEQPPALKPPLLPEYTLFSPKSKPEVEAENR